MEISGYVFGPRHSRAVINDGDIDNPGNPLLGKHPPGMQFLAHGTEGFELVHKAYPESVGCIA
jgi:hypothetical protein